jgi:hypothetical protein
MRFAAPETSVGLEVLRYAGEKRKMTTKELPDHAPRKVDRPTVERLLRSALEAAIEDLRSVPPDRRARTVFRPDFDHHIVATDEEVPSYLRCRPQGPTRGARAEAARQLTDYLWEQGQPKKTLTRDGDEDPDREAWAGFVWNDLILQTAVYLAERTVPEDLCRGREHQLWKIGTQEVSEAAEEMAGLLTNGEVVITAVCPIRVTTLEQGESFQLESGLEIESWTACPERKAVHFTRFHREYLPSDDILSASMAALKLKMRIRAARNALEDVRDSLDRFRWATLLTGTEQIVSLGTCIVRSATPHVQTVIRNEDEPWHATTVHPIGWYGLRTRSGPSLDEVRCGRVKECLALLPSEDSIAARDLRTALWSFGRACTAPSPRDSVLESAIGLERLLVQGKGDISYKFRLHGAAILADDAAAFDELEALYDLRSKAAHGGTKEDDTFAKAAPQARLRLARAVYAIAMLIQAGDIKHSQPTAAGVAQLVKRRATRLT